MNGKKILSFGLALVLSLSLLAGCGGGSSKTTTKGGSATDSSVAGAALAGERVEISFLVDKDTPIAGLEAVAKKIEEKYNIVTNFELRMGGSEGDNIVKTRLASGDMTDIFLYNTGALLQAISPDDYLLDLSSEDFASVLDDNFVQAASVNNKLYAIPYNSSQAGAWLYNKAVYAELGLKVPQTWQELMDNCKVIKEAGKTAIIGSYKDDWTSQLVFLSDEYNVLAGSPNFPKEFTENKAKYATDPAALRSWEKLAATHEYLNSDYLATTYDVALDMLVSGDGVHYPMLTQALSSIYQLYPEDIDNIGVFAQPGDDASNVGLTVWAPYGLYVNKNSPHVEAVKKWMAFYVTQEAVDVYAAAIKPDGPYAIKGVSLPEDAYAGVKEMQAYFDNGKTALALEFETPVKGSSAPQICVSVGSGILSPEEGATQYDQDVQKQAIQLNLPGWK